MQCHWKYIHVFFSLSDQGINNRVQWLICTCQAERIIDVVAWDQNHASDLLLFWQLSVWKGVSFVSVSMASQFHWFNILKSVFICFGQKVFDKRIVNDYWLVMFFHVIQMALNIAVLIHLTIFPFVKSLQKTPGQKQCHWCYIKNYASPSIHPETMPKCWKNDLFGKYITLSYFQGSNDDTLWPLQALAWFPNFYEFFLMTSICHWFSTMKKH